MVLKFTFLCEGLRFVTSCVCKSHVTPGNFPCNLQRGDDESKTLQVTSIMSNLFLLSQKSIPVLVLK